MYYPMHKKISKLGNSQGVVFDAALMEMARLKVGDELLDEIEDGDDPAARLDAEFALLALQLRDLFARLDAIFGLIGEGAPGA